MMRWLSPLFAPLRPFDMAKSEPTQNKYDPDDEPAPLGDVVRRGAAADRLLNDPTLAEAFKELREDLYAEWMATDPKQAERREELYYETHALHRVTSKLIAYRGAARIRADTERAA
jgi:hypothetical protein